MARVLELGRKPLGIAILAPNSSVILRVPAGASGMLAEVHDSVGAPKERQRVADLLSGDIIAKAVANMLTRHARIVSNDFENFGGCSFFDGCIHKGSLVWV